MKNVNFAAAIGHGGWYEFYRKPTQSCWPGYNTLLFHFIQERPTEDGRGEKGHVTVWASTNEAFGYLADACFLLVHRQLQLAHDLVHSLKGFFRLAVLAQDHKVVGIGDDQRAHFDVDGSYVLEIQYAQCDELIMDDLKYGEYPDLTSMYLWGVAMSKAIHGPGELLNLAKRDMLVLGLLLLPFTSSFAIGTIDSNKNLVVPLRDLPWSVPFAFASEMTWKSIGGCGQNTGLPKEANTELLDWADTPGDIPNQPLVLLLHSFVTIDLNGDGEDELIVRSSEPFSGGPMFRILQKMKSKWRLIGEIQGGFMITNIGEKKRFNNVETWSRHGGEIYHQLWWIHKGQYVVTLKEKWPKGFDVGPYLPFLPPDWVTDCKAMKH